MRRTLTQELAELERTNPDVKAAADNYHRTVRRILRAASERAGSGANEPAEQRDIRAK